ncbi:hypothetical protein FSP39_025226 [Pinctada imbricata]|uniref:Nudix hydrolase domain-containing protein n=1 Tax=Pinctada imbricata TaxID=66713 RepID=A0AA88Y106_PINIB|nr:hypothetical protein FSP39_025226 [Pinctada imbricata]
MMQEAKYSCHGSWYLPAGRVERGESLYEACQREVEEETGLKCEPQTLIAVEFGSGCWYRFTFTGRVTGGKLKTLEDKDKESLQAEWIDYENIKNKFLQLRAKDVIPLIKIGLHYKAKLPHLKHSPLLPVQQAHKHLINRPVIVRNLKESDIQILVNTEGGDHLPSGYDNNRVFSAIITPYIAHHHDHHEHVHFAPDQVAAHNLEIQIKQTDRQADVHLGFLQIHHHYNVTFSIADNLGHEISHDPLQNLHVQIESVMPKEDDSGHEYKLKVHAHKEKLMQEILQVRSANDENQTMKIIIHARVLGKGKGKPALKNGITCYKVDVEEDSDALSDWQGF